MDDALHCLARNTAISSQKMSVLALKNKTLEKGSLLWKVRGKTMLSQKRLVLSCIISFFMHILSKSYHLFAYAK